MQAQAQRVPMWELAVQIAKTEDRDRQADIRRELATRRRHYRLGWTASLSPKYDADLDRAERVYIMRHGETHWGDWMDGWTDAAAGREEGHLLSCTQHHNGEGGCGAA